MGNKQSTFGCDPVSEVTEPHPPESGPERYYASPVFTAIARSFSDQSAAHASGGTSFSSRHPPVPSTEKVLREDPGEAPGERARFLPGLSDNPGERDSGAAASNIVGGAGDRLLFRERQPSIDFSSAWECRSPRYMNSHVKCI
jgi:hypothetical protein